MRAPKGRDPLREIPPPPNPGGGPAPHYATGGKAKKHLTGEAGKSKRRLDRPGRAKGGRTPDFHPGGENGKLHRELGIPEGEKIGPARLQRAAHSGDPETARDAKRAITMSRWDHSRGR